LFVFAGKSATRLKVLWFDRNGLCMLYKRLHRATFQLPTADDAAVSVHIDAAGPGAIARRRGQGMTRRLRVAA
jgi:transposase